MPKPAPVPTDMRNTLQTVLCAMDAVRAIQDKRELQNEALSLDDRKAQLKDELRRIYAEKGITVDEEVLDAGVEETFAKEHTFKEPDSKLQEVVARLAINRPLQAILAAVVIGTAVISYGTVAGQKALKEHAEKARAAEIAQTNEKAREIIRSLETIPVSAESRPEIVDNRSTIAALTSEAAVQAQKALEETDLGKKKEYLAKAQSDVEEAKAEVAKSKQLALLFDTAKSERVKIRTLNPPQALLIVADTGYRQVESAVATGDLKAAQAGLGSIREATGAASRLVQIPIQIKSYLTAIASISTDPDADKLAASLASQTLAAVESGNDREAQTLAQKLESLLTELRTSYQIRIVSRPGERSGVWRTGDNKSDYDEAAKRYYVIVEAIDPSGNPITLPIRNEETGKVETTQKWGEKISLQEFERVKNDKLDNNIVDDNIVGNKASGSLKVHFEKGPKAGRPDSDPQNGRITNW